jgi:hypothetical protein
MKPQRPSARESFAGAALMAGRGTKVTFATAKKGAAIITANDDYLSRISPFDCQSKMQTNAAVTQDDLVRFMGANTLEWRKEEKQKVAAAIDIFRGLSAALSLPLPPEVFFVKTTGKEEGGAAYTRANAIFFPASFLKMGQERLNWFVFHELFHVLTRANPPLREQLYEIIGFKKCGEVELPPALAARKISNPDAPVYDHVIEVQVDGKDHWGVPIIYSEKDFDAARGKTFFDYLVFKLLLAEKDQRPVEDIRTAFNEGGALLRAPGAVKGFFEQVGRNTDYIIHPEEILAENFVHMLVQTPGLQSPEITARIRDVIRNYNGPAKPAPARGLVL